MKPAPDITPSIICKHQFPFRFVQCVQAFLNWPKFNHPTMIVVPYISQVKQLSDDTIEIWQRFDGDQLTSRPTYYQIQINRKNKELKGTSYFDLWDVSAIFKLKDNVKKGTVELTNTLYDGQFVNKAYVMNFDILVVQMWRYMKFKEYQERDWKEAKEILKQARQNVGSLVSENTYS